MYSVQYYYCKDLISDIRGPLGLRADCLLLIVSDGEMIWVSIHFQVSL